MCTDHCSRGRGNSAFLTSRIVKFTLIHPGIGPPLLTWANLSKSMYSISINFRLQMTPDGFALVGDKNHLFNCKSGQTLQLYFFWGVVLAALPLSSLLDLMFQLHWHLASHSLTSYLPLKTLLSIITRMSRWVRHSSLSFSFEPKLIKEDNCCYLLVYWFLFMVVIEHLSKLVCWINDTSGCILWETYIMLWLFSVLVFLALRNVTTLLLP